MLLFSAPRSVLSSALHPKAHCFSICLGFAERGTWAQPDASELHGNPCHLHLPRVVSLAHEGDG